MALSFMGVILCLKEGGESFQRQDSDGWPKAGTAAKALLKAATKK
jgi:hypothetical protein